MKKPVVILSAVLLLALGGCQVPQQSTSDKATPEAESQHQKPRVKALATPTHCGLTAPGLVLAQSAEDWQRLTSKPNAQLPEWPGNKEAWLLVVTTGQKYTGGYSLALESFEWPDKTLRIKVVQNQPEEGSLTTQVLTTPCLVLTIPAEGWESLIVAGDSPFPITRIHP